MKLNKIQHAVADAYGMGEFSHVVDMTQVDMCGDTLFLFIMRELEDVDNLDEAIRRMDRAISDITDISIALEEKL